jgi:rhamnosyltransferase subunit B
MSGLRESAVIPALPVAGMARRRIVLTTFGSLGDLHPCIAVALGLQARGHETVVATSNHYRQKVEALGIGFRAVRPDQADLRRIMDRNRRKQSIIRDLMMLVRHQSYKDTLAAAEGADLLVSNALTFSTRLVAEKKGLPWAFAALQPYFFMSAYDPPAIPDAPWLSNLRFLGPAFHRVLFWGLKRMMRSWFEPWHRFRAEIGLPPIAENPLLEGQRSAWLILAMFSKALADKQPDWPRQAVVTGFSFYDQDGEAGLHSELVRFLDAGLPPLVFTLGSAVVEDADPFYHCSAAAARLLGRRAILLVGKDPRNRPASLPEGIMAFHYAPYSELFPRAAAIIHQGGVGTTAQAMRSGRPMLVMPCAHDQPDNGERVTRLGIARTIARHRYTPARVAAELRELLDNPAYSQRASEVGEQVRKEDGVRAACDALEALLQAKIDKEALKPVMGAGAGAEAVAWPKDEKIGAAPS